MKTQKRMGSKTLVPTLDLNKFRHNRIKTGQQEERENGYRTPEHLRGVLAC
jgi:hypothetical protein